MHTAHLLPEVSVDFLLEENVEFAMHQRTHQLVICTL